MTSKKLEVTAHGYEAPMYPVLRHWLRLTAVIGLLFVGGSGTAPAADLTFGLDFNASATVGLDEPTRALIENLAPQVRQQVIEGLKEASPLIDEHVTTYLTQVNQVIDYQIDHASCAAMGTTQGIIRTFQSSLPCTSPQTPARDLNKLGQTTTRQPRGVQPFGKDALTAGVAPGPPPAHCLTGMPGVTGRE